MDGASLAEIAARAGYTRGAIYHQFASKDELFIEVMRHHDERLLDGYRTVLHQGERPDLGDAIRRWRELHPEDDVTVALRLELRSHALRDPTLRDQLVETDGAAVSATAEHLEKLDIPMPADVSIRDVAELLHIVSQAAQERGVPSGDDKAHLMTSFLEILWRPRD
jgi:AcrR family transcriptional regulator